MIEPDLHPDVAHLAGFLGTWQGEGDGHYPTIDDFTFFEEVTFGHVGKPFLTYVQRTRRRTSDGPGEPLHAETGYLRAGTDGQVELCVAQPTGIVEISEGPFDGEVMDLRAAVLASGTAKEVDAVRRRFLLRGDTLAYDLWMSAVDQDETHHLRAHLRRIGQGNG